MTKSYRMKNIDCANCAAKIEHAIKKLDGVKDISLNFMTQRLNIDADDSNFDSIMEQVKTIVNKIEPSAHIIR